MSTRDPLPDLGPYKLAMLSGGSQLAITTAATTLYRNGLLEGGPISGTLQAAGQLTTGADRLERAVHETVRHEPGITSAAMRARVAGGEAVQWMTTELTSAGLLLDEPRRARLQRLWLAGAAVVLLGFARFVTGVLDDAPDALLFAGVFGAGLATSWLAGHQPLATRRGAELVRRRRAAHDSLRRHPVASQSVMASALFGGGALWLADPAIASTLGVPRENARSWLTHGDGGGCGFVAGGGDGGGGDGGGGCGGGGCGGGA